jgi:DNA polymerase II small subunit
MRKTIVARFAERGTLVQPAALDLILGQPDPEGAAEKVISSLQPAHMVLTAQEAERALSSDIAASSPAPASSHEQLVEDLSAPDHPPAPASSLDRPMAEASAPDQPPAPASSLEEQVAEPLEPRYPELAGAPGPAPPLSQAPHSGIRVIKDVTGRSTCVGELQDFVTYFNDRMTRLKRMMRGRRELTGAVPISAIKGRMHDREVRAIGMVNEVRRTNKGRVIAEIEDEAGTIAILLPEENPHHRINIMKDEVIGVVGKLGPSGDIIYVQTVVRPDIPVSREPRRARDPICAAFISDIHVGSKTFLEEDWRRFTSWLRDPAGYHEDYCRRIVHLVISGDVVDGIGIYPDQEEDLAIRDVYKQYQVLSELLKDIPDRIHMIMLPGNHDAVRPAEPQPTFPQEIVKLFDSNITFVGNPCLLELEGVEVLAYHGLSIADFISGVPNLSFNTPIEVMKEMLRRRHLAPVFGDKTPLAPESRDWMVIDSIPDIFVTGHVHAAGLESYRGIVLINSSTWQSQTDYQKMMNFQPQPAKVAVVDLQTLGHRMISMAG